MKRYPVVIGATVAGLAGILSYHTSNLTSPLSSNLAVGPGSGSTTTTTKPGTTSTTGGTTSTTGGSSTSTTSTSAPPAVTTSSATGTGEQYGYGILSVKVTVKASKILDVKVAKLQTADTYSQSLAQQVIPYLSRQVLKAQSSRISGISGATYTSEAYAMSVQSALSQLHFR